MTPNDAVQPVATLPAKGKIMNASSDRNEDVPKKLRKADKAVNDPDNPWGNQRGNRRGTIRGADPFQGGFATAKDDIWDPNSNKSQGRKTKK